jgi:acyl-CoA reductase-like NAD-dependent aldehyde dehydrogenase
MSAQAASSTPHTRRFLLDGNWVTGPGVATLVSPWNGLSAGEVYEASAEQAHAAATAARKCMPSMRAMTGAQRADGLRKISEGIAQRANDFALLIRDEVAKPMALARAEVQRAVKLFQLAAEETVRLPGECIYPDREPQGVGMVGRVQSFPVGPVLGITPFNFPLNLVAHKVAPALAAACPIVIKPPPQGPGAALLLGEIVLACGFPAAAFQVLPGGAPVGQALCADENFAVVSFTGSAKAGWSIKKNALPHQRVFLELGGNAAVIVDESADLDLAARAISTGAYAYAGQVCISTQRVLVHQNSIKVFTQKLADRITADVGVGSSPQDEQALVGPLIDRAAADRVESWSKSAEKRGAGALIRGTRSGERLISPSLWENVPPDEPLWSEEVFGPVAAVQDAGDMREAIARANASRYGLQASVFTNSLHNAELAYRELECGAVLINVSTAFRIDAAPYGGVKDSGLGREGVRAAMREFCEPKLLIVKP